MLYKQAANIAVTTGKALAPFCQVINIVGSLRRASSMLGRERMEIKDIDLICVPKYTEIVSLELFGENKIAHKKVSINFVDAIKNIGSITKGSPDGRYMSLNVRNHKVDVFMPAASDYWRQYCIRTGSANYVHWNIAKAWTNAGWCGTDQGLRRISDCREELQPGSKSFDIKKKWIIEKLDGEQPPAWESEQHFFDWLGVKWIAPHVRSI